MLRAAATERVRQALGPDGLASRNAAQLAELANDILDSLVANRSDKPGLMELRELLREVVEVLSAERTAAARGPEVPAEPIDDPLADPLAEGDTKSAAAPEAKHKRAVQVKQQVMPLLMQRIDLSVASSLGPEQLRSQIAEIVEEIIVDLRIQLNAAE
jgi:hypothetical protein